MTQNLQAKCERLEMALREIAHGPCAGRLTSEQTTKIMGDQMRTAMNALIHEQMLEEGFVSLTEVDMPEEFTVVIVKCSIGERHMAYWRWEYDNVMDSEIGKKRLWFDYDIRIGPGVMVEVPKYWRPLVLRQHPYT